VIVVQLTGGMGNQMFQYATARALAARRGTKLVLDSSWLDGRGRGVQTETRRFELACFELDAPLAAVEDVARFGRSLLPSRLPRLRELAEPPFGQPCPGVLHAPDNTYLRGFWQNTTYFADAEPLLRRDFTFRPAIVEDGAALVQDIEGTALPTVSVHVRRGDYVTDAGVRDRMGTLDHDYYRRAVEVLATGIGSVRLFVFTDDPEWCEANLRLGQETTVIGATRDEGERWASVIHLMTLCDHHILANSSFSWWGAWLSSNPARIVVAPKPWLLDRRWDDEHRLPSGWIRIDRGDHQADQPPSTTTFAPVT
jgi:hypothetical protein